MTAFTVLSADEVLRAVITWAEAEWPVTADQAHSIVTGLGWFLTKSTTSSGIFLTRQSEGAPGGYFTINDGCIRSVAIDVMVPVAREYWPQLDTHLAPLQDHIRDFLNARWGQASTVVTDRDTEDRWLLPNGAEILVGRTSGAMVIEISSPELVALAPYFDDDYDQ